MVTGIQNLEAMFKRADTIDLEEGVLAYERYNLVMKAIADVYTFDLATVTAVFVSLSPNSSYHQNLRSAVSVLDGINRGIPVENITVSTYGHCKTRAYDYATSRKDFVLETRGPKILSFYYNILNPNDTRWVTVDGHMNCIWQGKDMTMRQALLKSNREYTRIKNGITSVAFRHFLRPCQMQAVLWFTRKRIANVVYDPQIDIFAASSKDVWKTFVDPDLIKPYPPKV